MIPAINQFVQRLKPKEERRGADEAPPSTITRMVPPKKVYVKKSSNLTDEDFR